MSFFKQTSRRKRSGSPSPQHQSPGGMGSSTNGAGTPALHRRAGGGHRPSAVLPVTVNDHFSSKPRRKPVNASSNSFLLGGMYVPGKDKRRRTLRSSRRYRFRITNQIVDLWSRLWYTSPAIAVFGCIGVSYILLCYLLIPLLGFLFLGSSIDLRLLHRGDAFDWLLTDKTLLLAKPKEERAAAEQLAMERERIRKQGGQQSRLELLESLAPEWYHRNDASQLAKHSGLVRHEYEGGQPLAEPKERPMLRTLHTMDTLADNLHCPADLSESDIQTTLVVQSSLDRIWVLSETCLRWADPIVAVVAISAEENQHEEANNLTAWKEKCPQLNLILYHLNKENESTPEQYPVNVLRNKALDEVRTSHILMVDVDFVPSQDLHETIRSVLVKQQIANDTTKQAMVVPAFARVLDPPCTTDADCRQHLRQDSSFIPHTFDELQNCYHNKDCIVFDSDVNWPGHFSTRSLDWLQKKWYEGDDNETPSSIRQIRCFETLRYEPYVVIRWCPTQQMVVAAADSQNNHRGELHAVARPVAPYYDERFHGYGKNKIEHISHLRLMGYQFRVLPEGFIVHNPHVESATKEIWDNVAESNLHQSMDRLYQKFVGELIDKYFETHKDEIVDQCPRPK